MSNLRNKLAVLTPVFTPYRGGIGVVAHANAKMAKELGFSVTVLTPWYPALRKKGVQRNEQMDGIHIQRLRPFFSYGNAALLPQLFFTLSKFDIIHLHYPFIEAALPTLAIKLLFRKKIIVTYHMDLVGKERIQKFIFRAYNSLVLPLVCASANAIIISSLDYARASLFAPLFKRYREKTAIIPHSVDTGVYIRHNDVSALRSRYDLEENQQVILFVGGLDSAHYFKGVEYLLEAFESVVRRMENEVRYPLPVLLLVGSGNMIQYYKNIAGQLDILDKVIFAGTVDSQNSLAKRYSLATVTVLPSIDQSESFGIVLIESLSCATPVIASDLAGIRSVVREGVNGFRVRPRDTEGLAEKIHSFLIDPSHARKMGETGRALVEQEYSYTRVKELFERIVRAV